MNSDKFNKSPFSANTKSIFPGDKGILLFYNDGNVKVYASIYDPKKEKTELIPIETDREWKIIETILDTIQEENNKKEDNK